MSKVAILLKSLIGSNLTEAQLAEIKLWAAEIKLADIPLKTNDGKDITVSDPDGDGVPMVGDVCSTGGQPCVSMTMTMIDGSVIVTDATGAIISVTPGTTETPEQLAAKKAAESIVPQLAQMSIQMKADKENFDKIVLELKKENVELKKASQGMAKAIEVILNTEIKNVSQEKTEIKLSQLTNFQKSKYNRGELTDVIVIKD